MTVRNFCGQDSYPLDISPRRTRSPQGLGSDLLSSLVAPALAACCAIGLRLSEAPGRGYRHDCAAPAGLG